MPNARPQGHRLPLLLVLALLLVAAGVWYGFFRPQDETTGVALATAERGSLRVTVLQGGTLEALRLLEIKSEVEGQASIISLVEEGTIVTPEDVAEGRILVTLDSSELEDRIDRQRIDLTQATAAYENAVSNLEIKQQENASEIRRAELDLRFAELDLERYVGRQLAQLLLDAHAQALQAPVEEVATSPAASEGAEGPAENLEERSSLRRLILTLLDREDLEGEALQRKREYLSDISLAEEEYSRAQVKLDWTLRLLEKGYVSNDDKEADRIALQRREIELERARTARAQYATYDFPKEVVRLLSEVVEKREQLERTRKRALSSLAMATAEASSKREQAALQEARYTKLEAQLAACVIRAEQPGLVVYASSGRRRRDDDRIIEGATVRERQTILRMPDLESMGVKVDVHESVVERVEPGQRATIVADALPDVRLVGVVERVARFPNPSSSWLNPDLKEYETTIRLEGEIPPTLRPGMSAQVEIHIADLDDVLQVPVQCVGGAVDAPRVWVWQGPGEEPQARAVTLGPTNDRFVVVEEGLEAGERVLLSPPRRSLAAGPERRPADEATPTPTTPASPGADAGGRGRGGGRKR